MSDIDIATPARPEEVVAACERAGLATVPTGLEHGTVTVIAAHTPVEVTTLRRDVETDGRRATVAFTGDWAEDARRRDFTMNALYCDAAGRVHDPVGGYPDLVARRVRFIGDADQRIAEDYLRILRFFRFHAAYAAGPPDAEAMAACARGLPGIARLSAERVRAELVKLLVAPGALPAVRAMADVGLLPVVLGAAPRPGICARVIAAEGALGLEPDPMLRLAALAVAVGDDIPRIAARLRLSNDERRALLVVGGAAVDPLDVLDAAGARRLVYRLGAAAARRRAVVRLALDPARHAEAASVVATAAEWQPPRLPVGGADLAALGVARGPEMGRWLAAIEAWWVEAGFPGADATRAALAGMISGGRLPPA